MELSTEEKIFIDTVKDAPGLSEFDFEKFRTTYPALLNGICLSMKAMVESVCSATDAAKKLNVAMHNLQKIKSAGAGTIVEEIASETLKVIK